MSLPVAPSGSLPDPSESGAGPGSGQQASLFLLGPEDLDACLALDALCLDGLWSPGQWQHELQEAQRPGIGLRHGETLEAMACGWLVLDELHITLVAVDPRCRRRGLGLRVLQALMQTGRGLGAERATLEVSDVNEAARALYGRCGFRTAGVRRRYYRDGSDALIQWTRLDDAALAAAPPPEVGGGSLAGDQGRFPEVHYTDSGQISPLR